MAQQAGKPPQDHYAQRGKKLASSVQRLRGWVGSDPSRAPELADALVELTEHRLLGHGYSGAAADAQDAVRRAAQLLTANGPIGPYTAVTDAVRCITTLVHLATIQVAVGLTQAAGQTMASVPDLRQQLRDMPIDEHVRPQTAIWALSCSARAALASGNVAEANAYADAALARLAESGLREDPEATYLTLDTDRLASDCRWAAGQPEEALSYLHAAKDRYDALVGSRLQEPGRLSPALLERLAAPLFGLYRDMADRLVDSGEVDLGLVTRRDLVDTLRGLVGRLGDPARRQLASALFDLANDLVAVDRLDEAATTRTQAEAMAAAGMSAIDARPRGLVSQSTPPVSWAPLSASDSYAAATASTAGGVAPAGQTADSQRETAAWLQAQRAAAHRLELERLAQARTDAERRAAERARAERAAAEQHAAEQARAEEAERREAEQQAAAEEAERVARKRRREERLESHRLEVERREAEEREAARLEDERRAAEHLAAHPAEAERLELKRLAEELAELERAEQRAAQEALVEDVSPSEPEAPEPVESEAVEPEAVEPERMEPERVEPEAESVEVELAPEPTESFEPDPVGPELVEPAAAVESEPEPLEPEPGLVVPVEPDELAVAQQTWREARDRGDRRSARTANERVVELLRARAEGDPAAYGPPLQEALVELASARLRGGDLWGSRTATKEAKALAKSLGR